MKARHIIIMWIAVAIMTLAVIPSYAFSANDAMVTTERNDRLTDLSRQDRQRPVAMINESTDMLRISMPSPQRLLPSSGFQPHKSCGRNISIHNIPVCNLCQTPSLRQKATPFESSVPRLYYVIALRRLIC
ncbi:MAG: hypothetical protein SOZ58_10060 [Prevotella sp.]|nr:hypothetical protein [Prevotella sp.]